MESSIYNAMNAANQLLENQNIISNNLANISTFGFKEKFHYILQNYNKNNKKNTYNEHNKILKEYYNLTPGALNYTGKKLDLFIKDNGWFTVKDINGQEAYTKNGHLRINSDQKLTIQDHKIIGNNGDIKIPKNIDLKISSNGIITGIRKNNNKIIETKIGILKLVRLPKDNLIQKENGLFYYNKHNQINQYKNIFNHDPSIRVKSGFLETSNVNVSKNMIEMIANARQFEMQMKMISLCDKNSEYANQLMNINN